MIEMLAAEKPAQIEAARELFREYERRLRLDLCFQDFERELAELPGKYAAPEGRLLLAFVEGKAAGCIALRKLEKGVCEMKRLYVRSEFRGRGLGRLLVERSIAEARSLGYRKMRLDTLPGKMAKAVSLYEAHGFRAIPAYYHNPYGETLFMEKDLSEE
jgi:GNAT superfamily N-acetyltransferase